ncbi:MAG TPA: GNAT family N-acetyltransferase [Solirubrobacteraceae bacterium]|jgi:GNAT superfamily N-acetyltransferase
MGVSATGTRVRAATHADLPAIVAAVGELLTELGSRPPSTPQMLQTAQGLLEDPRLGALLVAEAESESESDAGEEGAVAGEEEQAVVGEEQAVVGVLSASYQLALHVPGRYALIQDLWVHPAWRSRSVGRELLGALVELARSQGMARAEVGLPRDGFAGIRATEAFYLHNGFEHLGARMRRIFR